MPQDILSFQEIQSYTPAIDPRAVGRGKTYVLEGRNFIFDSKGVKSAFGSRLLHAGQPIASTTTGASVHSINGYVFTATAVGVFLATGWTVLYQYENPVTGGAVRKHWTHARVGDVTYYAHPTVGILKEVKGTFTLFNPELGSVVGVEEANGRLIVLTLTQLIWSAPGEPENFTPSLGGAGFQNLAGLTAGKPYHLTAVPDGVVAWTTAGGVALEYVGGEAVYRPFPLEHEIRPVSSSAATKLRDGSWLLATESGLYRQTQLTSLESVTPVFSEFLRSLCAGIAPDGLQLRLDYSSQEDLVFVQVRDWSAAYNRTYVLTLALDKWGIFSEAHNGILVHQLHAEPTRNNLGYLDSRGRAHLFMRHATSRETAPGVFVGLDSYVKLGPFRSEQLRRGADAIQEVQGLVLGLRSRPRWSVDAEVREDWNDSAPAEDWNIAGPAVNYGSEHATLPAHTVSVQLTSSLGAYDLFEECITIAPDEELVLVTEPSLIRESAHAKYYACLASGVWHTLELYASTAGQYFHVTFGELTLSYSGQLSR